MQQDSQTRNQQAMALFDKRIEAACQGADYSRAITVFPVQPKAVAKRKVPKSRRPSKRKHTRTNSHSSEVEWSSQDDLEHLEMTLLDARAKDCDGHHVHSHNTSLTTRRWKHMYARLLVDAQVDVQVLKLSKRKRYPKLKDLKVGETTVYGEAMPNMVRSLITKLNITEKDIFFDIGSGIGNVVTQIAAQTLCHTRGIELRQDLHNFAVKIRDGYYRRMRETGREFGVVDLYQGDATSDLFDFLFMDVTIVFMNNVCYNTELEQVLQYKFLNALQDGARVVAVKDLFPRINPTINPERWRNHPIYLFDYPPEYGELCGKQAVSWTSAPIKYHIYTVNRRKGQQADLMSAISAQNTAFGTLSAAYSDVMSQAASRHASTCEDERRRQREREERYRQAVAAVDAMPPDENPSRWLWSEEAGSEQEEGEETEEKEASAAGEMVSESKNTRETEKHAKIGEKEIVKRKPGRPKGTTKAAMSNNNNNSNSNNKSSAPAPTKKASNAKPKGKKKVASGQKKSKSSRDHSKSLLQYLNEEVSEASISEEELAESEEEGEASLSSLSRSEANESDCGESDGSDGLYSCCPHIIPTVLEAGEDASEEIRVVIPASVVEEGKIEEARKEESEVKGKGPVKKKKKKKSAWRLSYAKKDRKGKKRDSGSSKKATPPRDRSQPPKRKLNDWVVFGGEEEEKAKKTGAARKGRSTYNSRITSELLVDQRRSRTAGEDVARASFEAEDLERVSLGGGANADESADANRESIGAEKEETLAETKESDNLENESQKSDATKGSDSAKKGESKKALQKKEPAKSRGKKAAIENEGEESKKGAESVKKTVAPPIAVPKPAEPVVVKKRSTYNSHVATEIFLKKRKVGDHIDGEYRNATEADNPKKRKEEAKLTIAPSKDANEGGSEMEVEPTARKEEAGDAIAETHLQLEEIRAGKIERGSESPRKDIESARGIDKREAAIATTSAVNEVDGAFAGGLVPYGSEPVEAQARQSESSAAMAEDRNGKAAASIEVAMCAREEASNVSVGEQQKAIGPPVEAMAVESRQPATQADTPVPSTVIPPPQPEVRGTGAPKKSEGLFQSIFDSLSKF